MTFNYMYSSIYSLFEKSLITPVRKVNVLKTCILKNAQNTSCYKNTVQTFKKGRGMKIKSSQRNLPIAMKIKLKIIKIILEVLHGAICHLQ